MIDGLWASGTAAATDFSNIVHTVRLLGFNMVRLTFNFEVLRQTPPSKSSFCHPVSTHALTRRATDPRYWPVTNLSAPSQSLSAANPASRTCNSYLQSPSFATSLDRMAAAVHFFVGNGFYVMLNYHDNTKVDNIVGDYNQVADKWAQVWAKVACLPDFEANVAGRVLVDVLNEPDVFGWGWKEAGALYLTVMDRLHGMSPNHVLFLVEGTGQTGYGLNWGNGFVTDPDIISKYGISDPSSFFQQLLSRPYLQRTALSPHVYPPTVTKGKNLGSWLWTQLNKSFGYLQKRGFCSGGTCHRFPIVIGEFGSFFHEEDDIQWMKDFGEWMGNTGAAADEEHDAISSWAYWCYNANSGDTGGIVSANWQSIMWLKVRYLVDWLGLKPWYLEAPLQLS